jgi:hypothetical protein
VPSAPTVGTDPWGGRTAGWGAAPAPGPAYNNNDEGGAGGADAYSISTPAGKWGRKSPTERAPYDPHWRFDDKVAALASFKFDSKDPVKWAHKVRNYWIGKCSDIELLLDWAEDQQHATLTQEAVKRCGLAIDADPVQVSERIWSWLQAPLLDAGEAETKYNAAQTLCG